MDTRPQRPSPLPNYWDEVGNGPRSSASVKHIIGRCLSRGQVQDLEHGMVDIKEWWTSWSSTHEWELVFPTSLDNYLAGVTWLGQLKLAP